MKQQMKAICEQSYAVMKQHRLACIAISILVMSIIFFTVTTAFLTATTIVDDGQKRTVLTFSKQPEAILASAGVAVRPNDIVSTSDGHIHIHRAFEVTVAVEGQQPKTLHVTGGTVADALASVQINPLTHTMTKKTEDALCAGMVINLKPLPCSLRTETTKIKHETSLTFSSSIPAGSRLVQQAGVDGSKTTVYREYFKDGKLVLSEVVSETVNAEPVTEFATIGEGAHSISPIPLELDENGVPTKYKHVLTGNATAYTAKPGAVTATGTVPAVGTIGVNPKIIPYGSKLFIVTQSGSYVYGYGVARDTGGACLNNTVIADLYMDSRKECFQFGRRPVYIYILE